MTELLIQRYLRGGKTLADLKTEYGCKSRPHGEFPNLFTVKYDQIESPMGEAIVQECRGIILDADDNWAVVARPFDKFFNHGEGHAADIEWESAEVFEKLDGSLIIMYHYLGMWRIASSGTPDAAGVMQIGGLSFAELFMQTFLAQGLTLPDEEDHERTFMWELTSQFNRIVVRHTEPSVTLLGVRRTLCGTDHELSGWVDSYPVAKSYPLTDLASIIETMEDMDPMEQEGYIVRDASGARIKVKSPAYVAIHHLKDGMGPRRFLEIARTGETSEFLVHFPEYEEEYTKYKTLVDDLISSLEALYETVKDIEDQKTFALAVKDSPGCGTLFQMRRSDAEGGDLTVARSVASMGIKALERLLGLKIAKVKKEK